MLESRGLNTNTMYTNGNYVERSNMKSKNENALDLSSASSSRSNRAFTLI